MNLHRNARSTTAGRLRALARIVAGAPVATVAAALDVSRQTRYKWRRRPTELEDRSSRPRRSPTQLRRHQRRQIVRCRGQRWSSLRIAQYYGLPLSTVGHRAGPVALVLTRQKLPLIDRTVCAPASGVAKGACVLKDASAGSAPQAVILASGSEVQLALAAQAELLKRDVPVRVVSMPSMELFASQPGSYQDEVLPPGVRRVAVEAAHPMSWYRWVGLDGAIVGIETFGASAPYQKLFEEYGITAARVIAAVSG